MSNLCYQDLTTENIANLDQLSNINTLRLCYQDLTSENIANLDQLSNINDEELDLIYLCKLSLTISPFILFAYYYHNNVHKFCY
jgi:hypothetical protein